MSYEILTGPDVPPPRFDWRKKAEELEKENELLRLQIAARDKFLRETWEIIGSYAMGDTHDMVSKRKVFQAVHKGLKDAGIVCAK